MSTDRLRAIRTVMPGDRITIQSGNRITDFIIESIDRDVIHATQDGDIRSTELGEA